MFRRPEQLNLSNWRQSPYNRWSFHHVREVIPSEKIERGAGTPTPFEKLECDLDEITFEGVSGETWQLKI